MRRRSDRYYVQYIRGIRSLSCVASGIVGFTSVSNETYAPVSSSMDLAYRRLTRDFTFFMVTVLGMYIAPLVR